MVLCALEIQNVRNLKHLKITPSPGFTLIQGENGSGKTSILEAIHCLGLGRSFRTHLGRHVIAHTCDNLCVFAKIKQDLQTISLGILRKKQGACQIRMNQENVNTLSEITQILPVRVVHPGSTALLTGGTKARRQFMDWGVFYHRADFLACWQKSQRICKQRNTLLRHHPDRHLAKIWERELAVLYTKMANQRDAYVQALQLVLGRVATALLPEYALAIRHLPGWDTHKTLEMIWDQNWERDIALGYTQRGAHRADLAIETQDGMRLSDVLSQGQQKLLTYALYLSQGIVLKQQTGKTALYLLDDLPSELDVHNTKRVISLLETLGAQVFITGTDTRPLIAFMSKIPCTLLSLKKGALVA